MALITVNHQTLRDVASAIRTYCDDQDKEMRSADSAVKTLLYTGWTGIDAMEFGKKWEDVDAVDSTAVKLKESLKRFADALDGCAEVYRQAQAESYSDASRLPRW